MNDQQAARRRSFGWLDVARVLFLVAAIAFGWWGLHTSGEQIARAVAQTSPLDALLAGLLVMLGLGFTGLLWRRLMAGYGHGLPARDATSIFFVGQLGKYIPGSVWSLGAQADMARRFAVPARTTVVVGLLFLGVHVATAIPVTALLGDLSDWSVLGSPVSRLAAAVIGLLAITPPILNRLGSLLTGATERLQLHWHDSAAIAAMMAAVWALYGAATVLMVPSTALSAAGGSAATLPAVTGAFALSFVVGVVVIIAPAGVGAREATLVALLSPMLGLPAAAATALLIRAVHTVCDFSMAALAWLVARAGRAEPVNGLEHVDDSETA